MSIDIRIVVADHCRCCGHPIEPFMDLGNQPLAQVSSELADPSMAQIRYHLRPAVCASCNLFQVTATPHQEVIFGTWYPYLTGTSLANIEHFETWSKEILRVLDHKDNPFVVEIGSNDGTFLANFAHSRVRHLGVEPASNVAQIARAQGLSIIDSFFDSTLAAKIREKCGPADVIIAANVIAHIPSIVDAGQGVATLLKESGVFTFEAIYLADVIKDTMFDQIYAEHVFTFSVTAVANAFARCGLEVFDVMHQNTQGGSMRYSLGHLGAHEINESVHRARFAEKQLRLDDPSTYNRFANRCNEIRQHLLDLILQLRKQGYRLAGYGATAKGTTLLNFCMIDSSSIEFVADNTPWKQGRMIPGTSIEVRSPEYFRQENPDYALLLAWNHRQEIEAKELTYRERGGKWILYVPSVTIE